MRKDIQNSIKRKKKNEIVNIVNANDSRYELQSFFLLKMKTAKETKTKSVIKIDLR